MISCKTIRQTLPYLIQIQFKSSHQTVTAKSEGDGFPYHKHDVMGLSVLLSCHLFLPSLFRHKVLLQQKSASCAIKCPFVLTVPLTNRFNTLGNSQDTHKFKSSSAATTTKDEVEHCGAAGLHGEFSRVSLDALPVKTTSSEPDTVTAGKTSGVILQPSARGKQQ